MKTKLSIAAGIILATTQLCGAMETENENKSAKYPSMTKQTFAGLGGGFIGLAGPFVAPVAMEIGMLTGGVMLPILIYKNRKLKYHLENMGAFNSVCYNPQNESKTTKYLLGLGGLGGAVSGLVVSSLLRDKSLLVLGGWSVFSAALSIQMYKNRELEDLVYIKKTASKNINHSKD